MGDLLLKNLEVRSFRGFRHLKIERLGRVNLIVGKNNVGKSALLEALRLYASRGSPRVIWELLGARDESRIERRESSRLALEERLSALRYLFYGRNDIKPNLDPIQIGPINSLTARLSISVNWYMRRVGEEGILRLQPLEPEEYETLDKSTPRFSIQIASEEFIFSLDPIRSVGLLSERFKEINNIFRATNGLSRFQVGKLWDNIALTDMEKDVLAALRIIAPGVEGVSLVADPASASEQRIPIVRIEGIKNPIPLRNLGDGMQRMLGIVLALVNAREGMLLIDEIENGLHYLVQPALWRMVFQLARDLNVQVFATSHSWDCIEAFQQVAEEDKQTEGVLIRLESKKGEIVATLFDERELGIATREQIEVR